MKKKHYMKFTKITPPISGAMIAIIAIFSIVLASCSKDSFLSGNSESGATITAQQGTDPSLSYYAITDSTGIGFTSQGIEYMYPKEGTRKWLLSYDEIANELEIELLDYNKIRITRDQVLSNGLWRFAVSFDSEEKGNDAYFIDVNPDKGKLEWAITNTKMPGGEFTLSISVGAKR